jgi:hypothetical protein
LDRKAALEQRGRGLSNVEIAALQGVDRSTVRRFFAHTEPERQAVEGFKRGRADVLVRLQMKSLDAQERVLDLLNDEVLIALTPHQKAGLLQSLNAQAGTLYDKERLEVGKSTANVSSLGEIMRQAFQDLGNPGWNDGRSDDETAHQGWDDDGDP